MLIWLLLLFASIAIVFRYTVTKRLSNITDHFKEKAGKDKDLFVPPLEVKGNDEISLLASSFNALAERLSAVNSSLIERTKELEKRNYDLKMADEVNDRLLKESMENNRILRQTVDKLTKELISMKEGKKK